MTTKFYDNEEWKAYTPKLQALRREINSLTSKQQILLNKITDLNLVGDLLLHKMGEVEGILPKKQEKLLLAMTGHNSECWYYKYDSCRDVINEVRVARCVEVRELQVQVRSLEFNYKVLDKEQDDLRDRLIREQND